MTDLSNEELVARLKRGMFRSSSRFGKKILIVEGLSCWGTFHEPALDALEQLRWRRIEQRFVPPAAAEFPQAYAELCSRLTVAPDMDRDNMQPFMEGSYPSSNSARTTSCGSKRRR